jgi:broad specificity phosphatase PhoE
MTEPTRTVVHLMRHGEVYNPHGVLYGRLQGYRLSDLGREMAELVADHLVDHDVTHVVASPLERAQQTAEPIATSHSVPVTSDDRVIEAGSYFAGLHVAGGEGIFRQPRLYPRLLNPFRPSWGEPYVEIAARMLAAIADIRAAAHGHEAVVVSHQLPIWTARNALTGRRLWHDPRKRQCTLASLTSLTYAGADLESITYSEPAAPLLPLVRGKAVGA